MTTEESRFRAMGSDAHVVAVDSDPTAARDCLRYAQERIEQLEARWSRFRPTSEISRLNRERGRPLVVSRDTYQLVELAAFACGATGGRYDPTVLDVMEKIGYDRDYASRRDVPASAVRFGRAAPGCDGVHLDGYLDAVTLGTDVGFDPGGIGKGRAADLVVAELRSAGIDGVMVNLGGDVAVDGTAPTEHGWIVGIEDPYDGTRIVGRVTLESGGVCTSSCVRRVWHDTDGRVVHHLVDPRSGVPLTSELVTVTVVASTAAWAEITAKAVFVAASEPNGSLDGPVVASLLHNSHACCIDRTGTFRTFGDDGVFDLESDRALLT